MYQLHTYKKKDRNNLYSEDIMELNKSLVLFLIVATIIIETSTGAPPPPSPSGNMTCLPDLMMCSDGTASTLCCNSLRSIYDSDPNCLCAAQTTETFASLIGINGTQISELMDECKINTSTTFCSAGTEIIC